MNKIIHLAPRIGQFSFGVGQVALNIAVAQTNFGYSTELWCTDVSSSVKWASDTTGYPIENVRAFPILGPKRLSLSPQMIKYANNYGANINIIHQHSIWSGISIVSNKIRAIHGAKVIISPHGTLEEWALKKSKFKKMLAEFFYEKTNLINASCLHATSENEVNDFRKFGLKNPIALITNGIPGKYLNMTGDPNRFRNKHRIENNLKILLFISRITPKKGLNNLLDAIAKIKDDFSNWILIIAGNDEFNHKSELSKLVIELKINNLVRFLEPIFDQDKVDAFSAANMFILPSVSEGSPIIVFESLSFGVPVITTTASPWSQLEINRCGYWIEPTVTDLVDILKKTINLSNKQLEDMGNNGKKLIKTEYLWSNKAKKMIDLYKWLLGNGSTPDFVVSD